MAGKTSVVQAVSAGGVVYQRVEGELLMALCGRIRQGTWNLPKGTPDDGESIEETALREVREETGLEVEIEGDLGHIDYTFSRPAERVNKRVHFYLMRMSGGALEDHDPEFDVVKWFPARQALSLLTFPTESEIVRRALEALEPGA
ncbi:MAG: NUDIX hydrolase [Dehalococcoidia bacterium]